jgi:hypothetical protein
MAWPQFFASHTVNRETYWIQWFQHWGLLDFARVTMQPLQSAVPTLLATLDVITLGRLVWSYEDYKHIVQRWHWP